jgi:hypothetical protein
MWGCTIMLESGAVYRAVAPHAIAFKENPEPDWIEPYSQRWDCYGTEFSTIEYTYLRGLRVDTRCKDNYRTGEYMFTAVPIDDGFSRHPEQAKEFMFIKLDNGRLTIQPTDKVLFVDGSFTNAEWPTNLRTTDKVYKCE